MLRRFQAETFQARRRRVEERPSTPHPLKGGYHFEPIYSDEKEAVEPQRVASASSDHPRRTSDTFPSRVNRNENFHPHAALMTPTISSSEEYWKQLRPRSYLKAPPFRRLLNLLSRYLPKIPARADAVDSVNKKATEALRNANSAFTMLQSSRSKYIIAEFGLRNGTLLWATIGCLTDAERYFQGSCCYCQQDYKQSYLHEGCSGRSGAEPTVPRLTTVGPPNSGHKDSVPFTLLKTQR